MLLENNHHLSAFMDYLLHYCEFYYYGGISVYATKDFEKTDSLIYFVFYECL